MASRFAAIRLVAALTRRDLSRNIGTWRIPLASSALFAFLFVNGAFIASAGQERTESLRFALALDGDLEGSRQFVRDLSQHRFESKAVGSDELDSPTAAEAVEEREAAVGLTLPADFDARLAGGEALTVELYQRTEDNISQEATGWLLAFLSEEYGVNRQDLGGIVLDEHDIADDAEVNRDQFARLYAALAAFLGLGAVTAVASILGGTRDRRGAEALLVLPLPRSTIAGGTAAGALPLNATQVAVGLGALVSVALLPFPTLGQSLDTVLAALPATVLVAVLLAAFGGALGTVAGALGGGSSETMSVGDLLAMPVAALGVALLLVPDLPTSTATSLVPGLGALLLLRDAVLGDATILDAVLTTVGTLAGVGVLIALAGRLLGAERNVRRI
jgi:ABC-type Na+ efflux pump permease subunit